MTTTDRMIESRNLLKNERDFFNTYRNEKNHDDFVFMDIVNALVDSFDIVVNALISTPKTAVERGEIEDTAHLVVAEARALTADMQRKIG